MKPRYWISNGLKLASLCFAAGTVYSLIMAFSEEQIVWEEIFKLAGGYMVMFGILMSIVFATTAYSLNIPLAISFGATRREAFWGTQLSRGSYSITIIAAGFILFAFSVADGFVLAATLPLFLGLHLIFHSLGGILAILYAKFQKKGLIAGGIALTIVLVGFLFGFIFAVNDGTIPDFSANIAGNVLAVGVLAYIAVSLCEYRTIRTLNVKL